MAEGGPSRKRADSSGATLDLEVVRNDKRWSAALISDDMLVSAARAAFLQAQPRPRAFYLAALALTDDAEVRALNHSWRGKDAATNVLSFPAGDDARNPDYLGDIVLAYETVLKEAREKGIAVEDHVAHLVVHGVLHLLGFDHANDAEAERMEKLERAALASLGIADPYEERHTAPTAKVSP